jgi:outer membrane protein
VKRFWIPLIAAGTLAVAGFAQAENKIAVVSFSRLVQQSPQGKAASETLQKEASAKQAELAGIEASLKAKEARLTKDGSTMTADQRSKAEKDLRDGNRELQAKTTEFQDDLTARQNELLQRVQADLGQQVQAYAAAQKFDLVLMEGSIVYASSAMDITEAVLAAMPKTAASAPSAAPAPAKPLALPPAKAPPAGK